MEPHALPQPAPRLPPRVAAMVRWLVAHADEIDATDYGAVVFRFHEGRPRVTWERSEALPVANDAA